MNKNDNINVRNVYIELLNKLKQVEGVDIHYIDQLVALLEQDIGLIEIDVNNILDLIPSSATEENKLATMNDLPAAQVNSDWNATSGVAQILNKPSLATVATSGSYTDLSNKPTIPAAQVNSDWNATSGVAQILNKPTIPSSIKCFKVWVDKTVFVASGDKYYFELTAPDYNFTLDISFPVIMALTTQDVYGGDPLAYTNYGKMYSYLQNGYITTPDSHTIRIWARSLPTDTISDIVVLIYKEP